MARRSSPANPRKIPAQARSRATVDAIVQAATYILTEQGWDGLTTNAIATRAGVNISSLYQFFPNKEAVIAELQRRHAIATRTNLREVFETLPAQTSLREVLTLIMRMTIDEHKIAPAVHQAISEELPRTVQCLEDDGRQLRQEVLAALRPFMRNVPDPDLAIYLMGMAAHALVHGITADRPELFDDPHLLPELVTMFENYLSRSLVNGSGLS